MSMLLAGPLEGPLTQGLHQIWWELAWAGEMSVSLPPSREYSVFDTFVPYFSVLLVCEVHYVIKLPHDLLCQAIGLVIVRGKKFLQDVHYIQSEHSFS